MPLALVRGIKEAESQLVKLLLYSVIVKVLQLDKLVLPQGCLPSTIHKAGKARCPAPALGQLPKRHFLERGLIQGTVSFHLRSFASVLLVET